MAKKIKWTGSISYDIGGGKVLLMNEEYTLSDKELALLPVSGYKTISVVKETVDPDANKGGQNGKPEEDELLKDLTPDQLAFYTANTITTLKQKAQATGIDIPASITKKAEIYVYMLDNDFNIG